MTIACGKANKRKYGFSYAAYESWLHESGKHGDGQLTPGEWRSMTAETQKQEIYYLKAEAKRLQSEQLRSDNK